VDAPTSNMLLSEEGKNSRHACSAAEVAAAKL
jgi:hypothetical protein